MGRFRGGGSRAVPKRPTLTHFLCLPLVNQDSKPQLEKALKSFQEDVTGVAEDETSHNALQRIHPKTVRSIGTLHLTLGVMSLKEGELTKATDCLARLDLAAILSNTGDSSAEPVATEGIKIDLHGLESMHDVERTSILYAAPTDATNRLYPFCMAVQTAFETEGLLLPDDRKLKLHATLVNTIYAKSGKKKIEKRPVTITPTGEVISDGPNNDLHGHGTNADAPLKFDARSILDRYKDYIWAESILLDRVSICEMGAKKITDSCGEVIDERYAEVASVGMPT